MPRLKSQFIAQASYNIVGAAFRRPHCAAMIFGFGTGNPSPTIRNDKLEFI